MIFLPIVDRELRVAARKRSTFWTRIVAVCIAVLIGAGFIILAAVTSGSFGPTMLGKALFRVLTWLSFAAALCAGLFFTSDCLSEEKREGTLGFLFLTDLRGYDVVLGKLLATSMRTFYALFAVFPILAIPLLMGGVTGAEFWKTSLALANGLFLSLSAGLFVSAISRDPQKAMAAALVLIVLIAAVGPAIDATFSPGAFQPVVSASSPVYLFLSAGFAGRSLFWKGLLVNQLVAWSFLAISCVLLPRTWQEKGKRSVQGSWETWWKFGGAKGRMRLRRKLLAINPVSWLACRERWQGAVLWIIALLMTGMLFLVWSADETPLLLGWSYAANVLHLLLYLGIASQAGRFFVEAQRSGLIELLLATPVTAREIVRGQWHALLRMFAVPLAIYLAAQLVGTTLAQQRTFKQMASAAAAFPTVSSGSNGVVVVTNRTTVVSAAATGTTTTLSGGLSQMQKFMPIVTAVTTTLTMVANLVALCWFGMWMGLNSKSTHLATLKTIAFVQVVPWFVISFASGLIIPILLLPKIIGGGWTGAVPQMFMWFPLLSAAVSTVLCVGKDVAFVVWARRRLFSKFRDVATRTVSPISLPPALPTRVPPILPAPAA